MKYINKQVTVKIPKGHLCSIITETTTSGCEYVKKRPVSGQRICMLYWDLLTRIPTADGYVLHKCEKCLRD